MATKGQAASHSLGQSKSLDPRVKRKGVAQFQHQQQIVQLKYFLLQPGANTFASWVPHVPIHVPVLAASGALPAKMTKMMLAAWHGFSLHKINGMRIANCMG